MAKRTMSIAVILVILVGAFLLLDGISALITQNHGASKVFSDISKAFGKAGNTLAVIIAVLEVAAGALLIISRFVSIGALDAALRIGIFIFWIVVMVIVFIINYFHPDKLDWWRDLVNYSIILAVLWMIKD